MHGEQRIRLEHDDSVPAGEDGYWLLRLDRLLVRCVEEVWPDPGCEPPKAIARNPHVVCAKVPEVEATGEVVVTVVGLQKLNDRLGLDEDVVREEDLSYPADSRSGSSTWLRIAARNSIRGFHSSCGGFLIVLF